MHARRYRRSNDDNYHAGQNNRGIHAHETYLHVRTVLPTLTTVRPDMNQAVNDSKIEYFPQAFARNHQNGLNHGRIINFVDVILVLQQAGIARSG